MTFEIPANLHGYKMEDGEVTEKKKEEAREYYGIKKENSEAV